MILHKFDTSPFVDDRLIQVLPTINTNDGVLLTQDALYLLSDKNKLEKILTLTGKVYALENDRIARGLIQCEKVLGLSYAQMVTLSLEYNQVVSW